jgi:hypothetical protein
LPAGLLMAEMAATRGMSLGEQLKAIFAKVGSFYPVRENFHLTPEQKAAFTEKLKVDWKRCAWPPRNLYWASPRLRNMTGI